MFTYDDLKQKLYNSLYELGLSPQEINLYTLSLFLGPVSIAKLAEHLATPRPNIYKLIMGLENVGLAQFSHKKRYARTFVVEPPSVLTTKLREKKEKIARLDYSLTSLMPDLFTLYHQGDRMTNIKIIQGEDQYRKTFNTIFDEVKGDLYFFGSIQDLINHFSEEFYQELIRERMKRKLRLKALYLPGPYVDEILTRSKDETRIAKVMYTANPFSTSFQLSSNKVFIWQPNAPLALLIEDEYILQMLKSMFDMIWEITPETKYS